MSERAPSLFEAIGGAEGVLRLAAAWHERALADEVVAHAFSHGFHQQHTERLAAYWGEAWGGPATYSTRYGDESSVVRIHSGNGVHEEMDGRAIACFDQAIEDVSGRRRPPWRRTQRTRPTSPKACASRGGRGADCKSKCSLVLRQNRAMPGDPRPEELFVENLPLLQAIVALIARRYRLEPDQLDDLQSFVRLRMIENDFAILAAWRRTSSLRTYLTVVIQRLFVEYSNHVRGKGARRPAT